MTTNANAPYCFEVDKLKIDTKMSVPDVQQNLPDVGYKGKHASINDELYLHHFQMYIKVPITVTMTVLLLCPQDK